MRKLTSSYAQKLVPENFGRRQIISRSFSGICNLRQRAFQFRRLAALELRRYMLASRSWTGLSNFELPQKVANLRPLNLSAFEGSVMGRNRVRCKSSPAASPVCWSRPIDLACHRRIRSSPCVPDDPRLVDAILKHCGHLRISSQFYFYVLARHVLQQGGIGDRKLCDYVASLLETFSRANRLQISDEVDHRTQQYISDMLIALTRATPEQAFLLRAHIGNYSLFISGIFHENTQRRSLRGGPDIEFYEQVGRSNYQLVASHETARRCELTDVFAGLASRFHDVRLALNELSDRLLHLDEDARPSLVL